jgi:hypothetical protein
MENEKCKCGNIIIDGNIICRVCFTKMTSVLIDTGAGVPMYISSDEWKQYELYKELKRKWSWLD